ncbi:MAG: OmpA family protein [Phycisphaerae bacterium]|nr:OmpA family protein [Saprospiraceae bacterium]
MNTMFIAKKCPTSLQFLCQGKFLFPLLFCLVCHPVSAQSLFDSLYDARILEVHFASGKADLDPDSKRILDTVLLYFQNMRGEKTVRITAHTDSVGNSIYNEKLSERRAAAVSNWLTTNGLPENAFISVTAFGERTPILSNHTEQGRYQNRRATVEIARRVPMTMLEGRVTDKSTGEGVETTVAFRTKTRQDSTRTDTMGRYRVQLPKDSIVKIEVVAKDYFFESITMKILGSPELYKKYNLSPDIVLPPATPGKKAVLRDLFFMGDQAILLKASEPELPKILKFMQLNPDLVIEIGGHVNVPYPKKHNFKLKPGQTPADYIMEKQESWKQSLSGRRAKTVRDYLLNHGIPASRMTLKGYKNAQMLFPHATDSNGQEMNRRVEIMVTGRTGH